MFTLLERPPPTVPRSFLMPASALPPTDREQLREQAHQRLQTFLQDIAGLEGLARLEQVGQAATQAIAQAKTARQAAYDAALSASFYAGAPGLHKVLASNAQSWLELRRRALKSQTSPFLRTASPAEVAERAHELGIAEVPDAVEKLPQLAYAHVQAEEWAAAIRGVRDELVRSLYSVSGLNPHGITQPMLAQAAGISEQRVWQLINPDFRSHRPRYGNKPLYAPKEES